MVVIRPYRLLIMIINDLKSAAKGCPRAGARQVFFILGGIEEALYTLSDQYVITRYNSIS